MSLCGQFWIELLFAFEAKMGLRKPVSFLDSSTWFSHRCCCSAILGSFSAATDCPLLSSRLTDKLKMGNKPGREESIQQERTEIMLKVEPPVDRAYLRWLMRDLERIHRFSPRNPQAIKPPPQYEEFMRLNGWLDLDMDDPDLAQLFK